MTTNFGCALNAESIIDCLSQKKFYAIPSYQRAYKWDTEHVTRLLSEICRYYYDSTQKFQSCVGYDLTKHAKFIGTVILVRDEQLKKKIFETGDSEFYAVIDGQQRLTTCYLFYIALLNRLYYLSNKIAECIIDKITYTGNLRNVTDDINDCVKLIEPVLWRASSQFKPRLGREGIDHWGQNIFESPFAILARNLKKLSNYTQNVPLYDSSMAKWKAAEHLNVDILDRKSVPPNMFNVINAIDAFLDYICYGPTKDLGIDLDLPDDDEYPSIEDMLEYGGEKTCNALRFNTKYKLKHYLDMKEQGCTPANGDEEEAMNAAPFVEAATRLICFTSFFNRTVYVATVTCEAENYLDIFESLNTAGRPLSAIETFIPEVYKFFNSDLVLKHIPNGLEAEIFNFEDPIFEKQIETTQQLLDQIKNLIDLKNLGDKVPEAILISFALLYNGTRLSANGKDQRRELKNSFEAVSQKALTDLEAGVPYKDAIAPVTHYLRVLYETVSYWVNFSKADQSKVVEEFEPIFNDTSFSTKGSNGDIKGSPKDLLDEAKVSFALTRSINSTLAMTIGCRFYIQYRLTTDDLKEKAYLIFLRVVRALGAYSGLWFSMIDSTNGIEGTYRDILTGKKKSNDRSLVAKHFIDPRALISADEVIERLKVALCQKRLNKKWGVDAWKEQLTELGQTGQRTANSRFLHLCYLHHTEVDDTTDGMRRLEARPSSSSKYLTLEKWKEFYTDKQFDLEHVLPQSTRMSPGAWTNELHGQPAKDRVIHQLGNLTFIPKSLNCIVQDFGWDVKSCGYQCMVDTNPIPDVLENKINGSTAPFDRKKIKRSLAKFFKNRVAEKQIEELANPAIVWNEEFIQKRTERMAEIIWKNLTPFLNLDTAPENATSDASQKQNPEPKQETKPEQEPKQEQEQEQEMSQPLQLEQNEKLKEDLIARLGTPTTSSAERTVWKFGDKTAAFGVQDGAFYVEMPSKGMGLRCHSKHKTHHGANIWVLDSEDSKMVKDILRLAERTAELYAKS